MHNSESVTPEPEITYNSVSWNPDAIDVTVNPNKGRKPTEKNGPNVPPSQIPPSRATYHDVIKPQTSPATNPEKTKNFLQIEPGVKDYVLQSKDYKEWTEMKNSFLFKPSSTQTSLSNVQVAGNQSSMHEISRRKSLHL